MKITDVKTYVVDMYRANFVFIEIETDEGITGVGEATLEYREKAVVQAIEDWREFLIGKDPLDTELIQMHLERDTYWRYGPVLSSALSGIDIALWDIKGKYYGAPVYQLLGGKVREGLPIYVNAWFAGAKTTPEFVEKAKETVAKGFRALKWDPFGSAYLNLTKQELVDSIDRVAAIREAVGDGVDLLIECHGRFNMTTSVKIARALEGLDVAFIEEPLHVGRIDLYKRLKDQINIPIAAGERCYNRHEACSLIESGAIDVVQPDICHVGGITSLKKVASVAEMNYINVSPHNPMGAGANAATMHVMSTCMNFTYLETMVNDVDWRKDVVTETCYMKDGLLCLSDAPGIGIELHKEAFDAHPYKPVTLRHYDGRLTEIRTENSKNWF